MGGGVVFKYRIEDPRIGRFFAVDPLTSKFPELTPYQFASNSPIYMVELEGLEGFIVHGTTQVRSDNVFALSAMKEFARIGKNTHVDNGFNWGEFSNQFNTRIDEREHASFKLANYVIETRNKLISEGCIDKSEPITLIGYSHGGNVSIQAADEIYERTGLKVTIITIATPAYNSNFFPTKNGYTPTFESLEDPASQKGIDRHLHIYSKGDGVDWIASGNETYNNGFTQNYEIGKDYIPHTGWIDTHSALGDANRNSRLGDFLKEKVKDKSMQPEMKKTRPQVWYLENAKNKKREKYNGNK